VLEVCIVLLWVGPPFLVWSVAGECFLEVAFCLKKRFTCVCTKFVLKLDLNNVMTFEVTPVSLQHLTVTWEHRSLDMLATGTSDHSI